MPAKFIGFDSVTRGIWTPLLGRAYQGYHYVANGAVEVQTLPPWLASVAMTGTFTASNNSTNANDARFPTFETGNTAVRNLTQYKTTSSYDVNLNVSDSAWHLVDFYFYDLFSGARRHRFDVYDLSSTLLETYTTPSTYGTGIHYLFAFKQSVRVTITRTNGTDTGHSLLLFGPYSPHNGPKFGHYLI